MNEPARIGDLQYQHNLEVLADYERKLISADRLADTGTLEIAAHLDMLFRDPEQRWVAERNAERAAAAKTEKGGRPVDPTSRSQFSTWLRSRFPGIDPRRTYQLLNAHDLAEGYLNNVQITPTREGPLRALQKLRKPLYGNGNRIGPIWTLACQLAGGKEPTIVHIREAERQWNDANIPKGQVRKERAEDQLRRKRYRAQEKIDELFVDAKIHPDHTTFVIEQMELLQQQIQEDIAELRQRGQ